MNSDLISAENTHEELKWVHGHLIYKHKTDHAYATHLAHNVCIFGAWNIYQQKLLLEVIFEFNLKTTHKATDYNLDAQIWLTQFSLESTHNQFWKNNARPNCNKPYHVMRLLDLALPGIFAHEQSFFT